MQLERALLGGAVAVVVALLTALVVPGAIATPGESVRKPGPVGVAELSVQTGQVSGSTAGVPLRENRPGNPVGSRSG